MKDNLKVLLKIVFFESFILENAREYHKDLKFRDRLA